MSTRILPEFDLLVPITLMRQSECSQSIRNKAVLAGGTDLLVTMKDGYRVGYVISLAEISGLNSLIYDSQRVCR